MPVWIRTTEVSSAVDRIGSVEVGVDPDHVVGRPAADHGERGGRGVGQRVGDHSVDDRLPGDAAATRPMASGSSSRPYATRRRSRSTSTSSPEPERVVVEARAARATQALEADLDDATGAVAPTSSSRLKSSNEATGGFSSKTSAPPSSASSASPTCSGIGAAMITTSTGPVAARASGRSRWIGVPAMAGGAVVPNRVDCRHQLDHPGRLQQGDPLGVHRARSRRPRPGSTGPAGLPLRRRAHRGQLQSEAGRVGGAEPAVLDA